MEVVRELDADILCLQEVDNYLHFWVKELQLLGYTGELLLCSVSCWSTLAYCS
jgi:mRNA deadenylase 3'-5' endonuclease subunit Ccr4